MNLVSKRIELQSIETIVGPEVKNLIDFIENIVHDSQKYYLFKILVRNGDILIGYCGIRLINELTAVCFYFLYPQYRGNGYAIEATKKLFDFVFHNTNLVEIKAYIKADNEKSWKVAERAGMMYMGESKDKKDYLKLMLFKISKSDFERQTKY